MKPKLLIITNLYPTPWDNFRGTFNFQQFNYLAHHMDIRLIVPVSWKDRFQNRNKTKTDLSYHPLQGKVIYPWYWYTPGMLRGSYGLTMWASLRIQCNQWIKQFNPDYLLSSWAYPEGTAGTLIANTLQIPSFVKVHGSDVNITGQQPAIKHHIKAWGEKVNGVVSVSKDLKKKLVNLGVPESKIHVIYNGIDHQRFHPESSQLARKTLGIDEAPFVLYVGDLKRRKGCMDLLEAFLLLEQNRPDLKLYIAGAGVMQDALQQRIQQARMQERIILLGKVRHATLNQWYNAASIVCLPSYHEGVPNVLLEAMACGTPVVATNIGGIPEVIMDYCGLLIPPGNVHLLKNTLELALVTVWDHNIIQEYTHTFSWDENIRQLLDMFHNSGVNRG